MADKKKEKMKKDFREGIDRYLVNTLHTTFEDATTGELYKAVSNIVNYYMGLKRLSFNKKRMEIEKRDTGRKKICYICMEFLMGQSLKNNLYNLGATEVVAEILGEKSIDL